MKECNWPFWACLDGKSRAVLTDYQRTNYNPKWQPPQIDWGGWRHHGATAASMPHESVKRVMEAKPVYGNSNWRKA